MAKLKVRHGVSEIELEGSDAFIKSQLKDFYERLSQIRTTRAPSSLKEEILKPTLKLGAGQKPTAAEFYKSKRKTDGLSKILIFGKYLEEYQGVSEFKKADINKLVRQSKIPRDVHSQFFTNAVKQGLLRSHSGGGYSLTLSAEEVLASM